MPLKLPDDYWVEIPACRYRVGLEPGEMERFAEIAAAHIKRRYEEVKGDYPTEQDIQHLHAYEQSFTITLEDFAWRFEPERILEILRRRCSAFEVDVPAHAIARRPVTNEIFARFLAEVGGPAPSVSEAFGAGAVEPHGAVRGVSWSRAVQFAQWAGARLPFESEWERAARGLERRFFPWGNDTSGLGHWSGTPENAAFVPAPASKSSTPDGIEGMVTGHVWHREWCADVRPDPNLSFRRSRDHSKAWGRATRGGAVERIFQHTITGHRQKEQYLEALRITAPSVPLIPPSAVSRTSDLVSDAGLDEASPMFEFIGFRLVRADGRAMPKEPAEGPWESVSARVMRFEEAVVRPVLEDVRRSLELHRTKIVGADERSAEFEPDIDKLLSGLFSKSYHPRQAHKSSPDNFLGGDILLATSLETFRRVKPGHGVYLWQTKYRLSWDASTVYAHPVALFRMAYDGDRHIFHQRFIPTEEDTPIELVTAEMVRDSILSTFEYYERYADADRPPV